MLSDRRTIIITNSRASSMSPLSVAKKIAIGIVWVFPGILPASIKVAPNSPRARAYDNNNPDIRPGLAKGSMIRQKSSISEAPRVLALDIRLKSICWNAPNDVLYIKGKATTIAAITAAYHVNIILTLNNHNSLPIGPYFPSNNNSKNRNSWTPNQYEDPNTREKDTRSLLRQQEQMMAKQDQDLSELSRGIGDLKNIGVAIGEGVSLTSALLDDIGKGVDKTDGSFQKRTQKAKVLQKQVQGNCGLYVCIFLLIILLVFNISSKGFKNI